MAMNTNVFLVHIVIYVSTLSSSANCIYITDTIDMTTASGNIHKARFVIQSKAQFRHTAQNRFSINMPSTLKDCGPRIY